MSHPTCTVPAQVSHGQAQHTNQCGSHCGACARLPFPHAAHVARPYSQGAVRSSHRNQGLCLGSRGRGHSPPGYLDERRITQPALSQRRGVCPATQGQRPGASPRATLDAGARRDTSSSFPKATWGSGTCSATAAQDRLLSPRAHHIGTAHSGLCRNTQGSKGPLPGTSTWTERHDSFRGSVPRGRQSAKTRHDGVVTEGRAAETQWCPGADQAPGGRTPRHKGQRISGDLRERTRHRGRSCHCGAAAKSRCAF